MRTKREAELHVDPDTWQSETPSVEGSWWPAWRAWIEQHSGEPVAPPAMGAAEAGYAPCGDAPGSYVLEK